MEKNIRQKLRLMFYPLVRMRRAFLNWKEKQRLLDVFVYDKQRFFRHAGFLHRDVRESALAHLIMTYHVLEKGLTMPHRHLDFGHEMVCSLMAQIQTFEDKFGKNEPQVRHAIGLVKEYLRVHECSDVDVDMSANPGYWHAVKTFCANYDYVPCSSQRHVTRDEFFGDVNAPFPLFSASRHTSRHYAGVVDVTLIEKSVEMAMTAPSACNRQHTRIHCIVNHDVRDEVFKIQHGNRGFGQDADKVLVITTDMSDIQYVEERNDGYVNAGIFIMNLCYALHFNHIMCCLLNWHASRKADLAMRRVLAIPDSESIVAFIACGAAPESFDICASPRRDWRTIFTIQDK